MKKSDYTAEAIIARARKRLERCREAQSEQRRLSMEQLKFRHNIGQWPGAAIKRRGKRNPTTLTVNRIPGFIHSITNDQRQNRPSIRVNPVDERSDPEIAKIYQGLIRHIEYASNADTAYDAAHESSVTMGFGFIKISTDYESDDSHNQEIKVETIVDPFSVWLDEKSILADGSDAMWCGQFPERILTEDFADEFGDEAEACSFDENSEYGQASNDSIQLYEYYEVVEEDQMLHLMADGSTAWNDEVEKALGKKKLKKGMVIKSRPSRRRTVKGYLLSGTQILSEADWPSKWLPIIPVYGVVAYIEGKRYCYGLTKDLVDLQRGYNYWISKATEIVALAPKPSYVVAAGQLDGFEHQWLDGNEDNALYRTYNPKTVGGQVVAAPERERFSSVPAGIVEMIRMFAEDMKVVTGIYDAGLGNRSNETSGVAITARQKESEVSNYHYQDNFRRALRQVGRVEVDLIPNVLDTDRIVRILGEDDTQELVRIGGLSNDLSAGKYDVTVSTGPNFTTKRQEFTQAAMELSQNIPELWKVAGHLIIKAMNWPKADEIAELWQKAFAPESVEGGDESLPPEIQQKMQEHEQQLEELQRQLEEASSALEDKTEVERLKGLVQIHIERIRAASRLDVEELKGAITLMGQGAVPLQRWVEPNEPVRPPELIELLQPEEELPEQELPTESEEPGTPIPPTEPQGEEVT